VYRRFFYGELQIVTNLYHDVESGERSKMRGRSWVHPLRLIFYRRYPLFLKDYKGKNKVLFFGLFNGKNALILTTTGFSVMENSMMTPRRVNIASISTCIKNAF
jgi:hypothetical protein